MLVCQSLSGPFFSHKKLGSLLRGTGDNCWAIKKAYCCLDGSVGTFFLLRNAWTLQAKNDV